MKTTIEIPDRLFRKAKSRAAERGLSLKQLFTEALHDKLANDDFAHTGEPAWMKGFGGLSRLRPETRRIQELINETFDVIEPEDRE